MERSAIHSAWIALALCAGCAPDRPYVPRRELAERILEPPTLATLPAEEMPPATESDGKHNGDDHSEQPEEIPPPRSGRRLRVSQTSALAEPLDRPVPAAREEPAPPVASHSASASDELTLAAAIDLAYRNSPAIAAARARVDIAQADKEIAYSDFLPQLEIGYRHVAGDTRPATFVLPTIPTAVGNVAFGGAAEEFDVAELRAQWTLWDFGRTTSKYGQSLIAKEIAGLQYVRAQQTVAFDVTSAYFEALSSKASADVADESVRRAQSALDDAKNYFHRGNAIRNDVLRAELFLKEMQLGLVKAKTASGVALAKLNRAIGINPANATVLVELAEAPRFEQTMADSLQAAVDNRREFGVVERGIAKAKLGGSAAEAEFRPKVVVGGLGSLQQEHDPTRYAEHASAGIGIEMGLYQGGRRVAQVQGAQAEIDLAVAAGKQVCDQIAYEVKVAFLSLSDAAERIKVSRAETAQASENLRVVKSLLDRGDAIPTDLIEAELTMARAQQSYLIATYDYQTALARLAYAVGLPPESYLALPRR